MIAMTVIVIVRLANSPSVRVQGNLVVTAAS